MNQTKRMLCLDTLRGVAILLMICHHIVYDLILYCGYPWQLLYTVPVELLHYVSAGTFILLSGMVSCFSRNNIRRGAIVLFWAMVITLVTSLMHMTVVYGILHFLGTAMVLYGLTRNLWQKLPLWAVAVFSLCGLLFTMPLDRGYPTTIDHLWMFGFTTDTFSSADYFPLFPWLFLFLLGTALGSLVRKRTPECLYAVHVPLLTYLGQHSLVIYLIHQPILSGIFWIYGNFLA